MGRLEGTLGKAVGPDDIVGATSHLIRPGASAPKAEGMGGKRKAPPKGSL